MSNYLRYFLVLLVIVFCTIQLSMAQVTFSRGWGAGKRAALYDSDYRINPKSLAMLLLNLPDGRSEGTDGVRSSGSGSLLAAGRALASELGDRGREGRGGVKWR